MDFTDKLLVLCSQRTLPVVYDAFHEARWVITDTTPACTSVGWLAGLDVT